MNTILELENYCNLKNPVGALLFTGEWGCGKTFIIENDLKNMLKDSHVIIRISLFGIPSVEELHKAVKKAWIDAKGGFLDKATELEKYKGFFEKLTNMIPNKTTKGAIGSVLSLNLIDFVKIKNKINNKKVVLVFDDLERSILSIENKLGVINEYCENQHFNVIIIADESKLYDESYNEFKEKVVYRTVRYLPDYKTIIKSVINDIENEDYKKFLLEKENEIIAMFAGTDLEGNSLDNMLDESFKNYVSEWDKDRSKEIEQKKELVKRRPHNIRSLKAALQDFERIFTILLENKADNKYKWLFSFVSFSMAMRANLIHASDQFGFIFGYQDMGLLYPGFFDSRFLPNSLVNWVSSGLFDKKELLSYIETTNKQAKSLTPKEKVKNSRIDYLEESVAIAGMKDILQEAYNGQLELNEYVNFICNSKLIRQYNLMTLEIDWSKVKDGIKNKIKNYISCGKKYELHTASIGDFAGYSEEEKEAYLIIKSARDSSYILHESNRKEYINSMKDDPYEAFIHVSNKQYNYFDEEMAEATIDAFKFVDNYMKAQFPNYFEGIWSGYRNSLDISKDDIDKSINGFTKLKKELTKLCIDYANEPFKKRYTEAFISKVDKLLEDIKY